MALPFLPAMAWALALAIAAHPLHVWVVRRFPRSPNLSALLATVVVAVGLLGPTIFLVHRVASDTSEGLLRIQEMVASGELKDWLEKQPRSVSVARWIEANIDLEKEVESLSGMLRASAGRWIEGTVWTVAHLFIAVFLLFYLFRDRAWALKSLRSYLPMSRPESDDVLDRIHDMIHATVFGTLTVAAIQGILGGFIFWVLGVPGPIFWGAVMGFLGIIPMAGTFMVWVPAAGFLASQGSWSKALILLIWGGAVVSLIDNFLYPVLVGKEVRIHTALVFLSLAGGLAVFGVSGVVLGPVALVTALGLVDILKHRTNDQPG